MLAALPTWGSDKPLWIEAEGLAFITSPQDSDAARRRALAEAMVSAAFAGGTSVQGRTAVKNARVTSDLAIVRPTGRVLTHQVVLAQVDAGHWRVRIRALVGEATVSVCASSRRLVLDATPPTVSASPQVSAWSLAVARTLARDVIETIRAHPSVTLESISSPPTRRVSAALDYTTLTRGERVSPAGNQRLETDVAVNTRGAQTELRLTLNIVEPTGRTFRRIIKRAARVEADGLTALLSQARRPKGETALVEAVLSDVDAFLQTLACQPPEARLTKKGEMLSVPIGRRQGLSRATIAFVDSPSDTFELLEVVSLTGRQATLRPLDPTRSAHAFAGARVYFLETGS